LKENQYQMLPSSLHKTKKNTEQISPTPKYNPPVCLKLILHAKKPVISCWCCSHSLLLAITSWKEGETGENFKKQQTKMTNAIRSRRFPLTGWHGNKSMYKIHF